MVDPSPLGRIVATTEPAVVGARYRMVDGGGRVVASGRTRGRTVQLVDPAGVGLFDLTRHAKRVDIAHPGGSPWGSLSDASRLTSWRFELGTATGVVAVAETSRRFVEATVVASDGREVARITRTTRVLSGARLELTSASHVADPLRALLVATPVALLLLYRNFEPRVDSSI